MEDRCFGDTLEISTPSTGCRSCRKGISHGVNGVQCRSILRTPNTFGQRSAKLEWSGSNSGKRRSVRPWPYAAKSRSMGTC